MGQPTALTGTGQGLPPSPAPLLPETLSESRESFLDRGSDLGLAPHTAHPRVRPYTGSFHPARPFPRPAPPTFIAICRYTLSIWNRGGCRAAATGLAAAATKAVRVPNVIPLRPGVAAPISAAPFRPIDPSGCLAQLFECPQLRNVPAAAGLQFPVSHSHRLQASRSMPRAVRLRQYNI